jgi:hypothetical protein
MSMSAMSPTHASALACDRPGASKVGRENFSKVGGLCRLARRTPNIEINGVRVLVVWDEPMPGVGTPWFRCDCGRRARYLDLRDTIRGARCRGLENASDHPRRRMCRVGRVERLRRKLGDCELRPFAPLPAAVALATTRSLRGSSTRKQSYSAIWGP